MDGIGFFLECNCPGNCAKRQGPRCKIGAFERAGSNAEGLMLTTLHIGLRYSSKVGGGTERVFSDLAASLPGAGVHFIGAVTGAADLAVTSHGLVHSFAPEKSNMVTRLFGARKNLLRLLESERPDIVSSHFALYAAPILDKLSDRPLVSHFHGPWALESKREGSSASAAFAKSCVERSVYSRSDRLIVLSKAFAAILSKNYGVPGERIRVVPGAVDVDRFRPVCSRLEAREKLKWPANRPILLSIRRLVQRMGLQELIDAVAIIQKRVPDLLLCIGGTGPIRNTLERHVDELSIRNNVRFLGFVPEDQLPLAYRAADISVVPTAALEGFGLVAAESLAAGTPTMVTPVGGLPEVVADLSSELIFQSRSFEDLAGGLTAAIRGDIRLPTEWACVDYATRSFSRSLMASRVAAVYRELVN
jgi:glycosyltransferase involved in cell wall biosynthesis